jgi:TIR domain
MAYVPGFQHDVFVSYAHGDDREWIRRFVDRLRSALSTRLGLPADVWVDENTLAASQDFSRQIPESVRRSAIFIALVSPTYLRSHYCVREECQVFSETIAAKRVRFGAGFATELFAFRCRLLPIDNNEHWELFRGATDIPFCDDGDDADTYVVSTPQFEAGLRRLVGHLVGLLKRMRNQSTAVFLFPQHPGPDVANGHTALATELAAQSYRLLPDRTVNVEEQLRAAAVSVFLLGADFDDSVERLTEVAAESGKPWVVWCAPAVGHRGAPDQRGLCAELEADESSQKVFLAPAMLPSKVKEEVLALLRPAAQPVVDQPDKPRVYLVYNTRHDEEKTNAGRISFTFRKDVHFNHPDAAHHNALIKESDGVLLVWGTADEEWCASEFKKIDQIAPNAHGICAFDPRATKAAVIDRIRATCGDLYVSEQFGAFDPTRLEPFFRRLSHRAGPVQP